MRETVTNWAAEHVAPIAEKTDKENAFPMHLWKEMGSMGFLGVTAPGTCATKHKGRERERSTFLFGLDDSEPEIIYSHDDF